MYKALFILNSGVDYSNYSGYSQEANYSGYSGYSQEVNYSGYSGYSSVPAYSQEPNYSGYSQEPNYSGYSQEPNYSGYSTTATSGLYYSAKFIVDAIISKGGKAVIDFANTLDDVARLAGKHGATHIFIEGLWVPPWKFQQLLALENAKRKWHVRIHSEIPFLASENIAVEWMSQYIKLGVGVVANAQRAHQQIRWLAKQLKDSTEARTLTPLLPNCYPTEFFAIELKPKIYEINIGCFGAFRPLKNHLQQAFIALRYAEQIGKPLKYHVNFKSGQENQADFINVKSLIENAGQTLVLHEWENRETFLETLVDIDILLQVSMSETFNIVAADATLAGIPILISNEIPWAYPVYADPQEIDESIKQLKLIMSSKTFFIQQNREGLKRHTKYALEEWIGYLSGTFPQ